MGLYISPNNPWQEEVPQARSLAVRLGSDQEDSGLAILEHWADKVQMHKEEQRRATNPIESQEPLAFSFWPPPDEYEDKALSISQDGSPGCRLENDISVFRNAQIRSLRQLC